MGMVVRLPGAVITGDFIVTFVSVKVDLERLDAPPGFPRAFCPVGAWEDPAFGERERA